MRKIGAIVGIVAVALVTIHFCSLEGLQGLLLSALAVEEDTIFAPDYSDSSFRCVRRGMSEAEVLGRLPAPLGEVWFYDDHSSHVTVGFSGNRVDHVSSQDNSPYADIAIGTHKMDVEKLLGSPREKSFVYSQSRGDKSYHVRTIFFREGKVTKRVSEFYLD